MMSPELEQLVSAHPRLFVQQRKEWLRVLVDWETTNRYVIMDERGVELGYIAERPGTFFDLLFRQFLRSHRPLTIDVLDRMGQPAMKLSRPYFWFFSDLLVSDHEGQRLGSIHRQFNLIYKHYELRDAAGGVFAEIHSPFWRMWTFPVVNLVGMTLATIAKKWGGVLTELFTDADTFMVSFTHPDRTRHDELAVILAAAVSIDFDYFEHNSGHQGGLIGLLPTGVLGSDSSAD
jgi:uncharacterized protein YxjI